MEKKKRGKKKILAVLLVAAIAVTGIMAKDSILEYTGFGEESTSHDYDFTVSEETEAEGTVDTEDTDRGYSVSTSSDLATAVGMAVLESGGNAVDAAVAVAYTLAVVEPYGSGLGGSGGMLVYDMESGECVFYDYRACAGSATSPYDTVNVPGFVAGMDAVLSDYGTISLSDLIAPAIEYCREGFEVNDQTAYRLQVAKGDLSGYSFLYDEDGNYLEAGDTMYQEGLAEVLEAIRDEGPDVFYNGWIAEDIADACSLTTEDLAGYEVYKSEAVEGSYNGYTVYSSCAPLSGITLIQMLELSEKTGLADPETDPSEYLSQLAQITSLAYADRLSNIGDPSMYDIDMQELVSDAYISGLLGEEYAEEGYDVDYESPETTSFSIVDENGLAVVATNTLTQFWGSRKVVDGIFLNSTGNNFSSSGINAYEPGKRSRTYTAPTIIAGDGGYVLAIGTPGGNNIPARLFQVITDILQFGMSPQDAVDQGGVLYRNGALTLEVMDDGTTWIDTGGYGGQVIWRSTGMWWGSVSLAGYSDEDGAFSAYDSRRGATWSGTYNP